MYTNRDFIEISKIIRSFIPRTKEIILFGSYAREQAKEESDADIAVIVEKKFDRKEKLLALGKAWNALARRGYHVDIVIKTVDEFDMDKDIPVTLSHTIYHEGKCLWKANASLKSSVNG
ncbi:MAG: nucleotidyltransferase domain-containing protein [Candidatus Latescibacter sp.]|nr:nucleotidyltransferase domain-containing protein [Candidatus Latescibacter sp.]